MKRILLSLGACTIIVTPTIASACGGSSTSNNKKEIISNPGVKTSISQEGVIFICILNGADMTSELLLSALQTMPLADLKRCHKITIQGNAVTININYKAIDSDDKSIVIKGIIKDVIKHLEDTGWKSSGLFSALFKDQ